MQVNSVSNESSVYPADQLLVYTPEVALKTRSIFERLRGVLPEVVWPVHAPYVAAINELKAKVNAVILAHNYKTPEIIHEVADITGDWLAMTSQQPRANV